MSNGALWTTLAESAARFDTRWGTPWQTHPVESEQSDSSVYGIIGRYWEAIDTTLAPALVESMLASTTVTNPIADGHIYHGKYAISDAWDEADGEQHVKVYQLLTRVSTVSGDDNAAKIASLPTPEVLGARDNIDSAGLEDGTDDKRLFKFTHIDPASRENCLFDIADSAWNTWIAATYPVTGKTLTIQSRRWEIQPKGDRTGTLLLVANVETWTNTTPTGYALGFDGMNTEVIPANAEGDALGHEYGVRTVYPGVPISSAVAAAAALRDTPETTFGVEDIALQPGNNGEAVITTRKIKTNKCSLGELTEDTTLALALLERRGRHPLLGYNEIQLSWPNLDKAVADSWIAVIKAWTSFTYGGNTYYNAGHMPKRHKSGNVTVYLNGAVYGATGSSSLDWTIHDNVFWQQYFVPSDLTYALVYRVTVARRVCATLDHATNGALIWANASTLRAPTNRERGCPGGSITWNEQYHVYEAKAEFWEYGNPSFITYGIPADPNEWEKMEAIVGGPLSDHTPDK